MQRWYPGIGWSARTLPTDRSSFSDESGSLTQPRESFELPSDGWKWEQPWMIDLNEQLYDKEVSLLVLGLKFFSVHFAFCGEF